MQNVTSCLNGFLKEIAEKDELALIFLKELWPHVVGPDFSRQTMPSKLEKRQVTLTVASSQWVTQVEDFEELIIQSINEFWGCRLVEKIVCKIDLVHQDPGTGNPIRDE